MRLIEIASILGAVFCTLGGVLFAAAIVGFLFYVVLTLWIDASNKFRSVCKAESLIFEYRKNREEFLIWKENGGNHNAAD